MMNTSNRTLFIILLFLTILLAVFAADGLFYWMLEDKFEIDYHSPRKTEVNWMILCFGISLIYLGTMTIYFLHKVVSTGRRRLTQREKGLLLELIKRSNTKISANWEQGLLVVPINGITGSLIMYPKGVSENGRTLGVQASECQFLDLDGVPVIAALNLDAHGNLFELDLWKTDFSKVKEIADTFAPVTDSTRYEYSSSITPEHQNS